MNKPCVFLFAAALTLFFCISAFAVSRKLMSVQVRNGHVRSEPSFFGKVTAQLAYGDRVAIMTEKGSWIKVKPPEKQDGWMHLSALTRKKIVFKASDADVAKTASGEEVALAGKGFNEAVEKKYRSENKKLHYDEIDKMEKITVSQKRIRSFIARGNLTMKGGAR